MQKNFSLIKTISYFIYCSLFLAFIPQPKPISIGLDPSWSYAISQLAENNSVFGKDIVFTYGPLGYLIDGASLETNFWEILAFRWFVYLLLFIISLIRIKTTKEPIPKFLIGLSISLCLIIGIPTDYQILFIYLIILTFEQIFVKYPRLAPLFLGIIAGFCLLTKFSLGVQTSGSLIIFFFVNLSQGIISKSKEKITASIFGLLNSFLGIISTAWVLLVPSNFIFSIRQIIVNLLLAGCLAIAVKFYQKSQNKKLNSMANQNPLLPQILFYIIYSLLLVYTIFINTSVPFIDYIKNSLEISSGYSSAMSIIGNTQQLAIALANFFIVIWILFFLAKNGYINLSLSMLFVLWIAFKHGFVRQDGPHYPLFFITLLCITSLGIAKVKKIRYLRLSYYFYIYIIVTLLIIFNYTLSVNNFINIISHRIINKISYIIDTPNLKIQTNKISNKNLEIVRLPEEINKIIGNKTIDIIPWEISVVPSNNLNWQPRPIFQSYSAYTNHLDNLNFQSLSTFPRDFILYTFQSIDGRHPFFDEPKTFSFIYCNYYPILTLSGGANIIALLGKQPLNRCLEKNVNQSISLKWNSSQVLENIEDSTITLAKIKFSYSLFGKIYKMIFRAPPVYVEVEYTDDSKTRFFYRIIPENSENGVILSHLPRNPQEAMSFLMGNKTGKIKSFTFHNLNTLLYKSNIYLELFSKGFKN